MKKDDYKDYKTGDWYEIEQEELFYDPDYAYTYDGYEMLRAGLYRQFFEEADALLERKATVYDYHNIYSWIIDTLTTDIVFNNLELLMKGNELSITYKDIVVAFEKEKKKVDSIFNEFVSKLETPVDMSIKFFPEKADTYEDIVVAFEKTKNALFQRLDSIDYKFREYISNCKIEPTLTIKKIDEAQETILKKFDDFNNPKNNTNIMTEYDTLLLRNGSIDEKLNTVHSIPKIAKTLIEDFLMDDLKPEILQRYKYNGEPVKKGTAVKAIKTAKGNIKKEKTKKTG